MHGLRSRVSGTRRGVRFFSPCPPGRQACPEQKTRAVIPGARELRFTPRAKRQPQRRSRTQCLRRRRRLAPGRTAGRAGRDRGPARGAPDPAGHVAGLSAARQSVRQGAACPPVECAEPSGSGPDPLAGGTVLPAGRRGFRLFLSGRADGKPRGQGLCGCSGCRAQNHERQGRVRYPDSLPRSARAASSSGAAALHEFPVPGPACAGFSAAIQAPGIGRVARARPSEKHRPAHGGRQMPVARGPLRDHQLAVRPGRRATGGRAAFEHGVERLGYPPRKPLRPLPCVF